MSQRSIPGSRQPPPLDSLCARDSIRRRDPKLSDIRPPILIIRLERAAEVGVLQDIVPVGGVCEDEDRQPHPEAGRYHQEVR